MKSWISDAILILSVKFVFIMNYHNLIVILLFWIWSII